MRVQQVFRSSLLLSLLLIGIFLSVQIRPVQAASFTSPQQVPMGVTLSYDGSIKFLDVTPPNSTVLKRDSLIKYVDQNSNGHWDPAEPVVYDSNNDSKYESIKPIIAGTVSLSASLRSDPLIKYVDINGNNRWDSGEAVVYDSNNNNLYTTGKPVIAGTPIIQGASLAFDGHVKYIGAGSTWTAGNTVVYDSNNNNTYSASSDPHIRFVDTNGNGHWDSGEPVVYDTNRTGSYSPGDPVLYGSTPSAGTVLRADSKILFVDSNRNGLWDSGEAVVYDSNGNGVFDSGEPVILPSKPPLGTALSSDTKVRFVDANNNGVWDPGETAVYDTIGTGYFNATIDPHIKYWDVNGTGPFHPGDSVVYDKFGNGVYQTGDTVIAGPAPPNDGSATLTIDHHFHFVDISLGGHWIQGDTVIYDADSDHVYVTGDLIITGTPPPTGTLLEEPVVAGLAPAVGTPLKTDLKVKYLETNGNNVWEPGEAVVYDSNNDGIYDTSPPALPPSDVVIVGASPGPGTLLSEPVIAGPVPLIGTSLKSDVNLKFVGTGVWTPGETVTYDSNSNGLYDRGEPVIADGSPGRGVWSPGDVVAYDTNGNSIYNTGEPGIYGTTPLNGTALAVDPLIKYVDANSNGHWVSGDTVACDVNNNNVYDQGDLIIAGATPATDLILSPAVSLDPIGRTWLSWNEKPPATSQNPIVYFKTWDGSIWSGRQAVTSGSFSDSGNFVTSLVNETMMILWSSNRTSSAQIYYRLYWAGGGTQFPTTGPIKLTSSSMYDQAPTAVQDRNGRIWVAWARTNAQATSSQIYYKYYNGTAWSPDFPAPPASISNIDQASPYITQTKDGYIRLVWADNSTINFNLFYTSTNDTMTTLPSTGVPVGSWLAKTGFPFSGTNDDDHPVLVQSRDGACWIFFQRSIVTPPAENLYFASTPATSPNCVGWSGATQLTSGQDSGPAALQNSDHNIWVFYNSLLASGYQILYEKTSTPITGVNDVGVRSLSATPSLVRSSYPVNITTLVSNFGDSSETATLTLLANTTSMNTWSLNLRPGQSQTLYFNWTSAQPWGRYRITAGLISISPSENLANQGDDSLAFGPLRVSPPGDVNGDGAVNILDLALIAFCFNQTPLPGTTCNQYVDVNHDGKINILDLAQAAFYYNKKV